MAPNPLLGSLRLNFSNSRLSLPKLLDALEGLPYERIEELNASQNDLTDRSPKKLLRLLPHLRALRLNSAGLSAEGVRNAIEGLTERWLADEKALPETSQQRKASDRSSPASPSTKGSPNARPPTAPAATLCKLQTLELAACNADAAVPDLALYLASPCCSLTELDLSWNSLGPHAVQQLGLHLRQNITLRSLKLAHCHLKQSASVLLACLSTAKGIPLERLDLSRNDMPQAAFQELAAYLGSESGLRLKDLNLSGNGATVEESCSRVLGSALLESPASSPGSGMKLHLGGTKPFFDPAYGRWDSGPQLLTVLRWPSSRVMEVTLDHCSFPEAAVSSLARICLNVRRFSLCNCDAADGTLGQSFVVHLEDLTRGLCRRRGADPEASLYSPRGSEYTPGSQATRSRPRGNRLLLRELRLNDLQLQDGSVLLLSQALHWLNLARRGGAYVEVLELEGNHLTHEGVVALNLSPLRRLSLSRNKLRPTGGMCLGDLLAARESTAPDLDLELQRCGLNSEGILNLWQQVLPDRARVRRLNLADNGLDATTVQAMLDIVMDTGGASFLHELQLLPNPCGSGPQGATAVSKLLQHLAPWKSIVLQAPEMSTLGQLINFLGDPIESTRSEGQAQDSEQEFVVTVHSLHVLPNQWNLLRDSLLAATAPPTQLVRSVRPSPPFRRLGGCGGSLRMDFSDCDLSQAHFRAPKVEPEIGSTSIAKSARREWSKGARKPVAKSLASQARYVSGEDMRSRTSSSSRTPFRPALRSVKRSASTAASDTKVEGELFEASTPASSVKPGQNDSGGFATMSGSGPRIPALRVCREENFGILFERKWHVDLQVCTVLRELRAAQGLRLIRCSLTDNWLSQLGHSGNSSKWSAIRLLDLRYNALTSSSCPALATVISGGLQALLLDGNRLQSQGFEALCKVMANKALRWLSMADNQLGHPSGTLAAELFAHGQCSLKELSLAMNPISSGETACFLRSLAKLGASEELYIDLAQTPAQPQVLPLAARAIARCPGLVINLKGCRALSPENFQDLHGLPPGRLLL